MTAAHPPLSVPASPDYFLGLFRLDDDLRDLTFDTPAAYLAQGCWDGRSWSVRGVVRSALVIPFPQHVTAADFDREFPTLRGRTVGDVCRFLADRVPRPAVRPWMNDRTAGAFLHVRHYLAAAGADVSRVAPAAPLEPFLRSHPDAFGWPLHQLAPGLPTVERHQPVANGFALVGWSVVVISWPLVFVGLIGLAAGTFPLAMLVAAVVAGLVGAGLLAVGLALPPRRVALGELATFRDLARAVAASAPSPPRRGRGSRNRRRVQSAP